MTASAAADATLALVQGFEAAFNRHDVDALMAAMTEDCVFEIVAPAERGGGRWEGQAAVRTAWTGLEEAFPGYVFETEDVFACGDRCAYRWTLRWDRSGGGRGRIRGIDTYTVRDGKIARKYTYFAR
ncbi:MAG TPA: nuclear transport factor 2 family protein [Thermomicrobiales bacterium]|jgi:ketosteroid isomerase-like protein